MIKARIVRTQEESNCSMCGIADETINHLLSEYCKMAQREHTRTHHCMGKTMHWNVSKNIRFELLTTITILQCFTPLNSLLVNRQVYSD